MCKVLGIGRLILTHSSDLALGPIIYLKKKKKKPKKQKTTQNSEPVFFLIIKAEHGFVGKKGGV